MPDQLRELAERPSQTHSVSGLAIVSLLAGLIPLGLLAAILVSLGTPRPSAPFSSVLLFSLLAPAIALLEGQWAVAWMLAALAAILTGHGARGVIRRTGKLGVVPATIGVGLGYGSLVLLLFAFLAMSALLTFTDFGE